MMFKDFMNARMAEAYAPVINGPRASFLSDPLAAYDSLSWQAS